MITNAKILSTQTCNDEYHNYDPGPRGSTDRVMSRSDLMEFAQCPSRWIKGYKEERKEATDYGSMIDTYILDSENFETIYAVAPSIYYNEEKGEDKKWNWNARFCKEWKEEQKKEGKIVIKEEDLQDCINSESSMRNDVTAHGIINNSDKQVMIIGTWKDKSGIVVPLKALLDLVPKEGTKYDQYIGDLKTCRDASPGRWHIAVYKYKYEVQAAFYADMYNAIEGNSRDGFFHILQESFAPYEVGRRYITEEFIELGRGIYQSALSKYCECLKSGVWPGYDDDESRSIDGFTITEPEAWMVK